MKVLNTLLATLLTTLVSVQAGNIHREFSPRHAHIPRPAPDTPTRSIRKRCKVPPIQSNPPEATSTPAAASYALISVKTSGCGAIGATEDVTPTSGPNGGIDWMNCGINGGGWNPPYVQVSDIKTVDLGYAVSQPNSAFSACSAYVSLFQQYAVQNGLPAILLAAFAMQESSCNPGTVGGAGEQGLMQLTKDKCSDAPGGNCKDPDYNIKTGAKFFADMLASNNGDLLLSIGSYNGWFRGMTYEDATAAGSTSCCRCQNNLDYLQQFLNGWCQNINAYSAVPPLGTYFNLNKCGN